MRTPVSKISLAASVAALALSAAPAGATICPSGTSGPVASVYCTASGGTFFRDTMVSYQPTLYYRMNDGVGASTMAAYDDGVTHWGIDGEYKNRQDSGPIGVADDLDVARDFYGDSGYGFVNGVDAPNWNGSSPYGNYTMEAWVNPAVTQDGTIMEFGRAGRLYVMGQHVYFGNGDDVVGPSAITLTPGNWYMVVGEKSGSHLTLYVQQSHDTPTPWNPDTTTGTSLYRPEGQPTFYVGFGNQSGTFWFNGSIDEVAYFRKVLTPSQLALQYYYDPAPPAASMHRTGWVDPAATASTGDGAGSFSDNSTAPVLKNPAVNRPQKQTPAQKLVAAKQRVKALTYALHRTQIQLQQLKLKHASKAKIRKAEATIKQMQRQLKQAKALVKKLTPKKPAKKH